MSKFGHTIRGKRVLLCILSVLILAGIGGTIALVTEQMNFNNLFSLSAENIDHIETFDSPEQWQPCQEEPKTVVTTNNSTHPVKVRLSYDEWWRNQADTENLPIEQDGRRLTTINFQNENDWELIGDWYYWKGELAPGASTRSLFKSVTLDCSANFAVQHVCNGTTCEEVHSPYEGAKYHINIIVQTTEGDFPHDDEYFNVSIDPNGGEFNGSSAVYTDSIQYGTTIDLDNISYTDHELVDWTLNGSTSYTDSRIRITNHTTLVANWRSSIFHNITVDPNGGSLDGDTQPSITSVRQGEDFTLTDSIPTRDDYIFNRWDIKVGDAEAVPLTDHTFTVTDDATISAVWDLIIAQNTDTGEVYPSVSAALAAANSGETVILVRDTEEAVTNSNDITLDLNEHTITGSLTNSGDLTLLNGEINNPDGIALTNNGTLTMGINDYLDEHQEHANIQDDYVRLIGTTVGLKQNGTFNYYDGRIQGDVALDGGYDASPFYRNTFDETIVYFFPLVDHDWVADNQFTTLASADNAVSKTKVGGDIYYYDLQDNIDASSRTGYKIYAVRDFTAPYTTTVDENVTIDFDIVGFNVTLSDTLRYNGTFNITDSLTTVTRGDATIVYGGLISTPQTIINNGTLNLTNVKITGTTANDTINNNATVNMTASMLAATTGYVIRTKADTTLNLDADSYLYQSGTSNPALYNSLSDFTWSTGNIYGEVNAIHNYGAMTITGGRIESSKTAIHGYSSSNTIIDGGQIIVNNTANQNVYGIYLESSSKITINSGSVRTISSSNSNTADAVYTKNLTMNGGSISASKTRGSGEARAVVLSSDGTANINNGDISVTHAGSSAATGFYANEVSSQTTTINIKNATVAIENTGTGNAYGTYAGYGSNTTLDGGSITVSSSNGNAQGMHGGYWDTPCMYLKSGTINVHAKKESVGIYGEKNSGSTSFGHIYISGGTITTTTDGGVAYGVQSGWIRITDGTIKGDTYGVYTMNGGATRVGTNDGEISTTSPEIIGGSFGLYNGSVSFYDGVLRGELSAYYDGTVKTIADNSTISITNETIDGINYDTRRLENEHDVAQIGTTKYTQLRNAIDAAGTGDIIELLEDNYLFYNLTIPAEKDITIQTNNYDIITGNPIENNGKTKIINNNFTPSSPTFDYHGSGYFITNNADAILEIENVKIDTAKGIDNNGTLLLKNTSITATGTAVYNKGDVTALNNITLSGDSYSIYNDGGESSYTDIDVDGKIYNKSGILSLTNGTVDLSGSLIVWLISNQPSAELSLNNITETLDVDFDYTSDSGRYTYALYNSGTLYVKDSTISEILRKRTDAYAYAVYSTSSASFDNTSLVVDASNTTYDANQGYGIYTTSGNIEFKSGNISVNRNKSYGIYTETGTITLGIPEQPGPTYGKENADVSTTDPDIRAIGSNTGIGVKNASGGKVYFYDGRITGSTSAMPENPTSTEYMFDPKDYLDENNYHYRILEWRREQPGN